VRVVDYTQRLKFLSLFGLLGGIKSKMFAEERGKPRSRKAVSQIVLYCTCLAEERMRKLYDLIHSALLLHAGCVVGILLDDVLLFM
jgi:hypothetical protein